MARYIDADNLIDKCDCLFKETNAETVDFMRIGYNHAVADTIAIARNLPTADVVQVVRCKECKYREGSVCDYSAVYVRPNGYCQWGEKDE